MRATKCRVSALLATMTLTIALSGAALGQTPAQQQPTPEVLEYKGLVAAAREVEIAPRLDGLLSKINFAAGQLVKRATFCSSSLRRATNSHSHLRRQP